MRADANELVRRRAAADDGEVADLHMACEHHVVGQDDALADPAVVGDMRVGQKHAARPDARLRAAALGARIHGHVLADQAVLADHEPDRLAAVFQILRLVADGGEGKNARARADRRVAGEADVRDEPDPVAERHLRPDMAERSDLDAGAERRAILDDGARVDRGAHSRTSIAETSASQTRAPSTLASPRNHHMFRFLAIRVMWNLTWSPGTTGLRNFALSIVIR